MNPLLILVTLLAGRHAYGIFALAMGTTIGAFGELAVSGYGLWCLGIPLFPRWYGLDPTLKLVLKQYAPTIAGAMLMGCTTIVDQSMAAMLGSGSVAALNYGNKFLTMVLSVGLSSLSIAVLPSFSKLTAKKDWSGLRHVLFTYTRLIIVVTVPLTALLVFLSRPLIAIFFQGGAFTRQNADLVASVQSLLFLQLPFYSVGILYVRAIASLKRNHILLWGTVISVCVNALLNVIFMKIMGLPGIALSTSAVFLITSTYLGLMLYHALRSEEALQPSYAMAVNSGT
jgi:putative peptidoglycan lipid II flippase